MADSQIVLMDAPMPLLSGCTTAVLPFDVAGIPCSCRVGFVSDDGTASVQVAWHVGRGAEGDPWKVGLLRVGLDLPPRPDLQADLLHALRLQVDQIVQPFLSVDVIAVLRALWDARQKREIEA